jgi:outer membrane protein OmpA-like peptidoglycan-associated protein
MNFLQQQRFSIFLLVVLFATWGCASSGTPPAPPIVANVVSEPAGIDVAFRGKVVGQAPLELSLDSFDEVVLVSTLNDEPPILERRIKVLGPDRVEIQIRVSGDPSPLVKALGLSQVTVFDYGDLTSFDSDSFDLKPSLLPLLRRQASLLVDQFDGVDVYICGHTDAQGGRDHNLSLSLHRAQSVADFLGVEGVQRERLKVQGFGPEYPLADNQSSVGRALNRRTEIILPD